MNADSNSGVLLSGKTISKEILLQLNKDVQQLAEEHPEFKPGLTIVQVGNREDSNVYIRQKLKAAEEVGISAVHVKLPSSTTQSQLVTAIDRLNNDNAVHGVIVQLPLDSEQPIDSSFILRQLLPEKDVDGLHELNMGRLASGEIPEGCVPCTPAAVLELIRRSGIDLTGRRAVVIGRSRVVGSPVSDLLKWANCTTTVCHSKTIDLPAEVARADIVVACCGQERLVKGSWLKPGCVVIDCGIHSIADASKKTGRRLVGDVEFDTAVKVASHITPVPGGVGPMTVAMLMSNTVKRAAVFSEKCMGGKWSIRYLTLNKVNPVPNFHAWKRELT